jgi:hypothetical protein
LALLAGLGGWGLVTTLNRAPTNQPEVPEIEIDPERPVTQPPTPEPEPEPEPPTEPVEFTQNLDIRAGESTTVEGSLKANETVNYIVAGREGETLLAQLAGEGVLMTVLAPNGNPPDRQARRVLGWTGTLELTGDYTVQLRPVEGVEQSDYRLDVSLSEGDDPEAPTEPETPEPPTEPETPETPDEAEVISEQRVRFPAGQNTSLVANSAGPGRIRRYVVNLREGEVIEIRVARSTAPTSFTVKLPTGDPLASSVELWEDAAPVGGDYVVDVTATSDSEFTLQFLKR